MIIGIIIYAIIGMIYTLYAYKKWDFHPDTLMDYIFVIGGYIMMINYFPLFMLLDIEEYYVLKKYGSFDKYRSTKQRKY